MVKSVVLKLVAVRSLDKLGLWYPSLLINLVAHMWLWPELVLTVVTQVLVNGLRGLVLSQMFERSREVDLALEKLVTGNFIRRLKVLRLQLVHVHFLVHHLRNLLIIKGFVLLG